MMNNLEELIQLRQNIHSNPEPAFEEFSTQSKIWTYLLSKKVDEKDIISIAKTGLVVNIKGKGPEVPGPARIVAFRADIDALRLKEANPDLQYRSKNNCCHACCHDGHIACLLGGITKLLDRIDRLPANRIARFLFQPAEEGYMGAKYMIEEGCLENVEEVWGLHASLLNPVNRVAVRSGIINAGTITFNITYRGVGGHSSLKKQLKDPVFPICALNLRINKMVMTEFADSNDKLFTICCPRIESSSTANVISNTAVLGGKLRYIDEQTGRLVYNRVRDLAESTALEYKMEISLNVQSDYPSIINDEGLVKELRSVRPDIIEYPEIMLSSDDFSLYAKKVKGCYVRFFIGSQGGKTLHTPGINFNDDCIEAASSYWMDVIACRLNMTA